MSGVSNGLIDTINGNSLGPTGSVDAVSESGYFNPATSNDDGYPIIGYISPTNLATGGPAIQSYAVPAPHVTQLQINSQVANK